MDSGLMSCYNENIRKDPLQKKFRTRKLFNNEILLAVKDV